MRHQVELTVHKALAGVHFLADEQVQTLFDNLLLAELPSQTMLQALHVATGNDPLLKRVVTDHIDFPQITVSEDDAKYLLEQATGKLSATTMKHVAVAMGFTPRELKLEPAAVPPEQKARIIRAAEQAGIPQQLISTIQQEL